MDVPNRTAARAGYQPKGTRATCHECGGAFVLRNNGRIRTHNRADTFHSQWCHGSGTQYGPTCPTCHGTGHLPASSPEATTAEPTGEPYYEQPTRLER